MRRVAVSAQHTHVKRQNHIPATGPSAFHQHSTRKMPCCTLRGVYQGFWRGAKRGAERPRANPSAPGQKPRTPERPRARAPPTWCSSPACLGRPRAAGWRPGAEPRGAQATPGKFLLESLVCTTPPLLNLRFRVSHSNRCDWLKESGAGRASEPQCLHSFAD
jgi:hypothetical protein